MSKFAALFVDKGKAPKPQEDPKGTEKKSGTYKILFVDDEKNVLKSMVRIFRMEKYAISTASSGIEALALLEKEPVHIIISDHRMPGMTGAELLQKVRGLYPKTIRIMLTGHADVGAIMGAVNDGAVYKFITKPWNDEDLRLTVSLALEQYDLIEENEALKVQKKAQDKKIKKLSRFVNVHRSQIGNMLRKKDLISKEDLESALIRHSKTHKILPLILVENGLVDESTIMKMIQSKLGINRVYPNEFTVPDALAELIPREICEGSLLVPLKQDGRFLIVAMADPTDQEKIDELRFITGITVQPVIATQKEITEKLQELYDTDESIESAVSEMNLMDPSESIEIILDEDDDADISEMIREKDRPSAIRIVNAIISDALRHNASDIHIEPKTKYTMVRYRKDGLLQDKIHIPSSMHLAIVSRIKVMSELDISERRKPQDGRVTVKTASKMVDLRLSMLPTISGEKIVMRILDRNSAIVDLSDLGMSDADLEKVSLFITQPQGMLLTTGPTGSGKTSTLYSILQKGASITKNYTTIEDPVEYFMGMAEQVMIREKVGITFPLVLRALLRQDPNVIMLGEIRDHETAEVALHAASTGHFVLSTLHTNSSIASIMRLRDLGIESYGISDALNGIIAQRLVRCICPHCKVEDNPSDEILHALKLNRENLDFQPRKGEGCAHCDTSGYKGRTGIFEVFSVDHHLRKMIHQDATEAELLEAAQWAGMTTLLEDAVMKIKAGITTFEEVIRVLGAQSIIDIQCPHCNVHLGERYKFCPFCGQAVTVRCEKCDRFLAGAWNNCPYCGKAHKPLDNAVGSDTVIHAA